YIRNIFPELNIMHIRSPSYINDIALSYSSKSLESNCKILELAIEKLLQMQTQNNIQFNMEKTELIHFHSKRIINYQDYIVQIGNMQIEPKSLVRWLGIWLDSKLNFKEHMEKKIADATRIFHQIIRLFNTEKG